MFPENVIKIHSAAGCYRFPTLVKVIIVKNVMKVLLRILTLTDNGYRCFCGVIPSYRGKEKWQKTT